jgi:uncharacterized protein YecT (DUF1311 family)
MDRLAFRLVLGTGVVAAALFAPAFGQQMAGVLQGRALAEDASPAKQAFEAAKELGTVEAWDAFLSNYPAGFYADLARAYVKKLAGQPAAEAPAAENSAPPSWCGSPQNAAERAICRDPDLSRLDGVLNVAYKRAKFDSPKSVDEIDHEQKRWLSRRNLCGDDPACIRKRYDEQIQILESFFAN